VLRRRKGLLGRSPNCFLFSHFSLAAKKSGKDNNL